MLPLLPVEVKHGQSTGLGSQFWKQPISAVEAAPPHTWVSQLTSVWSACLIRKAQMTPLWKWAGSLEVGRKCSWPRSDKVLLCIAVCNLLFLIYTCLKCIERGIFYWSTSGGSVLGCCLCLWKSHFSHLTALLHFATPARASLILSWPRWLGMNVLSKQSEAELPLRWVRGENVGKGREHPKHKEIIVFSFNTICFPGWWALMLLFRCWVSFKQC